MTIDKDELRRLAEASVGGEWEFRLGMVRADQDSEGYIPIAVSPACPRNWRPKRDANMAYIAAANPTTILALLDELEKAQKDSARMDWIEENYTGDGGGSHFNMRLRFERDMEDFGDAARGIIDAAMQEQKP